MGDVYRADADVTNARAGLIRMLGFRAEESPLPDPEILEADDTIFLDSRWNQLLTTFTGDLERRLLQLAHEHAPDLETAGVESRIAELELGGAKRAFFLPTLSLSASYQDITDQDFLNGAQPLFPAAETGTWQVNLKASLPLFNGGRRYQEMGRARANQRLAGQQKLAVRDAVDERLRRALAETRASLPNIELTQRAADRARLGLAIVQSKYEEGKSSLIDLLEAQDQNLTQGQRAALAEYTHLANLFALQRALGFYDLLAPKNEGEQWLNDLETWLEREKSQQQGVSR